MEILALFGIVYGVVTLSWVLANLHPEYGCEFQPISIYWPLWIVLVLPIICFRDLKRRIFEECEK